MKHAVVVSRLFAPEPAAAAFRLEALVRALATSGHDVTVLTSRPRPGSPPADDGALTRLRSDVQVPDGGARSGSGERASSEGSPAQRTGRVRVRRARVARDSSGYVRGYVPYLSFDLPAAVRLLTVRRPDVVVVEPPPTTGAVVRLVCAIRRVPYVYYAADVWSDAARSAGQPGLVSRVLARVEGWAMRGARGVVAGSEDVADRVRELARHDVDVEIVRNGIDTAVFRPATRDAPSSAPREAPGRYFLYAGTASEWQGSEVFVLALEQVRVSHPDVELVFLGSGSAWEGLRDLADRAAPGAVHLRGPVGPKTAAHWLRHAVGALVSIVPGVGYDFALPTKIFAASASGVPVIFAGPRATARDVVVEGDLGQAVGHDPEAVAAAMIGLLDDAGSRDPDLHAARAARLAAWTTEHASIDRVGQRVAALVARWADGEEGPA